MKHHNKFKAQKIRRTLDFQRQQLDFENNLNSRARIGIEIGYTLSLTRVRYVL